MMVKSGLEFFYFEIERAPLDIIANCQANSAFLGRLFALHWPAATLKGHGEFQNKKILDHFSRSFLTQKFQFQDSRF